MSGEAREDVLEETGQKNFHLWSSVSSGEDNKGILARQRVSAKTLICERAQ
jgi:hypothetical protein